MSTYTPNVPQAGQRISQTQSLINENFLSLDAAIKNDHVDITDVNAALRMLHKQVTFPDPLGADPVVAANDAILYTKDLDNAGLAGLFFKNASTVFNMLPRLQTSGTNHGFVLPGGIIVKFGKVQGTNTGYLPGPPPNTPNVTFLSVVPALPAIAPLPVFTNVYMFLATCEQNGGARACSWSDVTNTTARIWTPNSINESYYLAIGV